MRGIVQKKKGEQEAKSGVSHKKNDFVARRPEPGLVVVVVLLFPSFTIDLPPFHPKEPLNPSTTLPFPQRNTPCGQNRVCSSVRHGDHGAWCRRGGLGGDGRESIGTDKNCNIIIIIIIISNNSSSNNSNNKNG
jgi:hypothetical protein